MAEGRRKQGQSQLVQAKQKQATMVRTAKMGAKGQGEQKGEQGIKESGGWLWDTAAWAPFRCVWIYQR